MEARSIRENHITNGNWIGAQAGAAWAASRSATSLPEKEKDNLPAYLSKPCLCNEDIERLIKAYCCLLHRSDGHTLLQCEVFLRYFDISVKQGASLPKESKTSAKAQ
eukprot:4400862-Ditylum_brightwellii.AAC.1